MNTPTERELRLTLTEAEWQAFQDVAEPIGTDEEVAKAWVLDRLGRLPEVYAAPAWPPAAEVMTDDDRLRVRYQPSDTWILFVVDSLPADGRSFYHADSSAFDGVRAACTRSYGPMPDGPEFLEWLRARYFWTWDVLHAAPRSTRGRPPKGFVDERALPLARILRDQGPDTVIVIGSGLEPMVRQAESLAQFRGSDVRVLPYPSNQWRARFVQELSGLLRNPITPDGPVLSVTEIPPVDDLASAMECVLRARRGSMSGRELANVIAHRDLFRGSDGRHPRASQVKAQARRDSARFVVDKDGIDLVPAARMAGGTHTVQEES